MTLRQKNTQWPLEKYFQGSSVVHYYDDFESSSRINNQYYFGLVLKELNGKIHKNNNYTAHEMAHFVHCKNEVLLTCKDNYGLKSNKSINAFFNELEVCSWESILTNNYKYYFNTFKPEQSYNYVFYFECMTKIKRMNDCEFIKLVSNYIGFQYPVLEDIKKPKDRVIYAFNAIIKNKTLDQFDKLWFDRLDYLKRTCTALKQV